VTGRFRLLAQTAPWHSLGMEEINVRLTAEQVEELLSGLQLCDSYDANETVFREDLKAALEFALAYLRGERK
jgi:hypothetical protein